MQHILPLSERVLTRKMTAIKYAMETAQAGNANEHQYHRGKADAYDCVGELLVNEINAYNKRMTCKKRVKEANDEKTI